MVGIEESGEGVGEHDGLGSQWDDAAAAGGRSLRRLVLFLVGWSGASGDFALCWAHSAGVLHAVGVGTDFG